MRIHNYRRNMQISHSKVYWEEYHKTNCIFLYYVRIVQYNIYVHTYVGFFFPLRYVSTNPRFIISYVV